MAAPILFSFCGCCMASCYEIYVYSDIYNYIYISLMLQLYKCTGVYIVKYRQSIAFGNIYIGGHFLGSRREKSDKRPQIIAQVTVCRRSEHHTMFIGCQNQRCSHYCLGQERRYP